MGDGFGEGGMSDEGENIRATRKPHNKRFKETSKRLRAGKENHLSHRASLDWRHDARRVCETDAGDIAPPSIAGLKETLMKSRTAEALLAEAADVAVHYDLQNPGSQYYAAARVIALNPGRTRGDLLNLLARELRRAWQHARGALVNPLKFEPDEAILVNRAQVADAFMIGVRIAWELKLAGEQEAWNHIAGSPMADIGRIYEVKAQTDFRTLNSGEAARVAYDKFFEDSRTKLHDKRLIHQMLLDEHGYMHKNGAEGASAKNPRISIDLFKKMGELPQGRNYLSVKGARAPMDPAYAAVEDRSNANFLWFIKFERSFHEKEMQMVQESVKLSAEIVDFAKWSLESRKGRTEQSSH